MPAAHLISFHHIVQILWNHFDWHPSDILWEGSTQRVSQSLSTEVTPCSSQRPKTFRAMVLSRAFWVGMLTHVAAMKCPGSKSFIHASAKATDGGPGWHQLQKGFFLRDPFWLLDVKDVQLSKCMSTHRCHRCLLWHSRSQRILTIMTSPSCPQCAFAASWKRRHWLK